MRKNIFQYIKKSKFIRSIFFKIIGLFVLLIIAIALIVYFSFSVEINKHTIDSKEKQLEDIVKTLDSRMNEVIDVCVAIGQDQRFTTTPSTGTAYSSQEMTDNLKRFLTGNDFIDFLVFYRSSEPDKIYTNDGERSLEYFTQANLNIGELSSNEYFNELMNLDTTIPHITKAKKDGESYLTYVYFPKGKINGVQPSMCIFVYMPISKIKDILQIQINDCDGKIALYNIDKKLIYELNTLDFTFSKDIINYENNHKLNVNGSEYVFQQNKVRLTNWTCVSAVQLNNLMSTIAKKQIVFVCVLTVILFVSALLIVYDISKKYQPILDLADKYNQQAESENLVDEQALLTDSFAKLQLDSENKEKFETAYLEADAASKAKSAFLSNMSHDIRTPMNAIIGMTDIAFHHSDDTECVRECLKKIQISSAYLLDIINNVLDMSRIESGKYTLNNEVIELSKLVYNIYTIINQNAEAKGIYFNIRVHNIENEKVIGDSVKLTQVFINILSNAVKFTNKGGKIDFDIYQKMINNSGSGEYSFIFRDNGIGISKEFIPKVFDTFTRDDNVNSCKTEGTGLGMAIAKNLIEIMGGTIMCESELGLGTTFIVKIKMKYAKDPMSSKWKINDYRDFKVLIIGENKENCQDEEELFSKFVGHVDTVNTICDAHEKMKMINPYYNIVLINQFSYDKNGVEVVKSITNGINDLKTKFILLAKDFAGCNQSSATNIGITSFVKIPIFKNTVINILEDTVGKTNSYGKSPRLNYNFENKNILIAEDNEMNMEIVNYILKDTKANLTLVKNGQEAVDVFSKSPEGYFDIILMDIQMPIKNGYEATKEIRLMLRSDAIIVPIIALTANTFDEDVRKVNSSGMNGHIGKPYVPKELYETINIFIKNK